MILITKNETSNKAAVTLKEKSQLLLSGTTPTWLFSITHTYTSRTTNFIPTVISSSTRCDIVEIDETALDLDEGIYLYEIYEQASGVNTDPDLAFGSVEKGVARVIPANPDFYN